MFRLGIDPEKLYRATFICQDGLCCCNMALISFRLFHKNLGNLRVFLGKWFTAPPGKKFPVRLCSQNTKRSTKVAKELFADYVKDKKLREPEEKKELAQTLKTF